MSSRRARPRGGRSRPAATATSRPHLRDRVGAAVGHPLLGPLGRQVGVPAGGEALQRVAQDVHPGGGRDHRGLADREVRVDHGEGGPQGGVADAGLDVLVEDVEHAHRRRLAARAGGGRHGEQRQQRRGRRASAAHRGVDVVHELAGVGGEQVDGLAGVDRRAAADGEDRVEGTVLASEGDRVGEGDVGRLDPRLVVDDDLDAVGGDLVGDPRRVAGGGDAGVGHEQHPPDPPGAQVVADLRGRAAPHLEGGGGVGEDGLAHGSETTRGSTGRRTAGAGLRRARARPAPAAAPGTPGPDLAERHPGARVGGAVDLDRARVAAPDRGREDQLGRRGSPPAAPRARCRRSARCRRRAGADLAGQPRLLGDLAHDGVARVLPVVDAAARQHPLARVRPARGVAGQQDGAVAGRPARTPRPAAGAPVRRGRRGRRAPSGPRARCRRGRRRPAPRPTPWWSRPARPPAAPARRGRPSPRRRCAARGRRRDGRRARRGAGAPSRRVPGRRPRPPARSPRRSRGARRRGGPRRGRARRRAASTARRA